MLQVGTIWTGSTLRLSMESEILLNGNKKGKHFPSAIRSNINVALVGCFLYVVTKLTGQLEELWPLGGRACSRHCTQEPVLSPRTSLEPSLWLGAGHHLIPHDVHMDSRAPGLAAFRNI